MAYSTSVVRTVPKAYYSSSVACDGFGGHQTVPRLQASTNSLSRGADQK